MLTRKQMRLLRLIHDFVENHGIAPSFEEMRDNLQLRSKSGVHRMVAALKEKGYIRKLEHRARAIEVLPRALDALRATAKNQVAAIESAVPVALMGRIAAGAPLEAIPDGATDVQVPPELLGRGEHYALEIVGDSMTGLGIMDGDTVIVEKRSTAENGEVVVALVDESEATLKRFFRRKGAIELRAANPEHPDRRLAPERVRVQGRLRALMRRY